MYYTCLTVTCWPGLSEILIAEISQIGFNGFLETETGFEAFANEEEFDADRLRTIFTLYSPEPELIWSLTRIEEKNWNAEWEKNFEPVVVEDKCFIRAEFHHRQPRYPLEIIITPAMSFGTGHHATTYLMVKTMLTIDHQHKNVMDAGCGTGILSVLASKLGADRIEAFDINPMSFENASDNIRQNDCLNVQVRTGIIQELVFDVEFDIIVANITKNVLTSDLAQYHAYLKTGGFVVLSGFYEQDAPEMQSEANRYGFRLVSQEARDRWVMMIFTKD